MGSEVRIVARPVLGRRERPTALVLRRVSIRNWGRFGVGSMTLFRFGSWRDHAQMMGVQVRSRAAT
jgi:hypothetical protein